MIETELLGLLGILRELVSKKGELDKSYFENFIQPTWESFEKIHELYKTSFREYTNFIQKDDAQVDTLLEMIRRDFIYSQDLRVQLKNLAQIIPSSKFKTKERSLSDFLVALGD